MNGIRARQNRNKYKHIVRVLFQKKKKKNWSLQTEKRDKIPLTIVVIFFHSEFRTPYLAGTSGFPDHIYHYDRTNGRTAPETFERASPKFFTGQTRGHALKSAPEKGKMAVFYIRPMASFHGWPDILCVRITNNMDNIKIKPIYHHPEERL